VYCLSGGRSATAAGILQQAGIDEVYNGGGIGNMQLMLM
jgi:rhodanese-related sulfurtransferase